MSHFVDQVHVAVALSFQTIHLSKQNNCDDFLGKEPFHPISKVQREVKLHKDMTTLIF